MGRLVRSFAVLFVCVANGGCGGAMEQEPPMVDTTDTRSKQLLELAEELPRLRHFRQALNVSGYREVLEGTGPFTVFAPVDEAFTRAMRSDSTFAGAGSDSLRSIVGLHVVRGSLERLWRDSMTVSTMSNHPVTLRKSAKGLTIQDKLILGRFVGRNGMLYVIPSLIMPPPPDTTRGLLEQRAAAVRT